MTLPDKMVCYSKCWYEYRTILSPIQMPAEFWTIVGHLNNRQVRIYYSDVSAIQIFAIQIPSVTPSSKIEINLPNLKACTTFNAINSCHIFWDNFYSLWIWPFENWSAPIHGSPLNLIKGRKANLGHTTKKSFRIPTVADLIQVNCLFLNGIADWIADKWKSGIRTYPVIRRRLMSM